MGTRRRSSRTASAWESRGGEWGNRGVAISNLDSEEAAVEAGKGAILVTIRTSIEVDGDRNGMARELIDLVDDVVSRLPSQEPAAEGPH